MKHLIASVVLGFTGLIVGGHVGLAFAPRYVVHSDGTIYGACGNDYMLGGGVVGIVVGAALGVGIARYASK